VDEVTLNALLKTAGLPVAYHHFVSPPQPPYIVYMFAYSSNFGADDKVYDIQGNYQVELYTTKKDLASEKLIENLFDENDIYWEKTETYIDSEGLYQVLYEI
jgi:hypothetical protein